MVRALAFAVLLPSLAAASSLTLTYRVEERGLEGVPAGTTLYFEVYSDPACASWEVTRSVAIEEVDLISRLRLFRVSGALAKPPATVELQHAFAGAGLGGSLYVKLTGHEKIVPVGGACQAQAASAPAQVLVHTATAANTADASTTIDYPRANGHPRTLPQVTHLYLPPFVSAVNDPNTVSVKWDNDYGRWIIFHDNGAAIPLGAQYIVRLVEM